MNARFVIGVTGGIGSGKSFVCRLFNERHGIVVIDADIVAREVVAPGEAGLGEVVTAFGTEILTPTGELDRARLRRLVFAEPERRRVLEGILHPRIAERMRQHIAAAPGPYCLVGIPLLTEGGRRDYLHRVLLVDCTEDLQVSRVMARDHLTEPEVIAIMRTQATREQRRALADDIIMNDGDAATLTERVDELHRRYLELAASAP